MLHNMLPNVTGLWKLCPDVTFVIPNVTSRNSRVCMGRLNIFGKKRRKQHAVWYPKELLCSVEWFSMCLVQEALSSSDTLQYFRPMTTVQPL